MALPDKKYERRSDGRSVYGIFRLLRRPMLRLHKFNGTQRISLSERNGTAANAALSSTVSLRRKSGETAEFDRSGEHRARCHSGKRRPERPNFGCRYAVR